MQANVAIWQLPVSEQNLKYINRLFRNVPQNVNLNDYKKIWTGNIEVKDTESYTVLDRCWEVFNVEHPSDYTGRSLSVSDIVEYNGEFWGCQSLGWLKLQVFSA